MRNGQSRWKNLSRMGKGSVVNAGVLFVLWATEHFIAEKTRFTTLLTYGPQLPFLLPTLGLILAAIPRWRQHRKTKVLAFNVLVSLFGIVFLAGYNVPTHSMMARAEASSAEPSDAEASSTRSAPLRVMTFNIALGAFGTNKIVDVIKSQNPDVLCLQETLGYNAWPDPIPLLQARLIGYSYMARTNEVTTFSRFPILSWRAHKMPSPSSRAMLETVLDVRGQKMTVFNVHIGMEPADAADKAYLKGQPGVLKLGGSTRTRSIQSQFILNSVRGTPTPFLVCGDFNFPPRGLIYRKIASELNDSFRQGAWGCGHSFSASLPLIRIDYVWTSDRIQVLDAHVLNVRASDHRPYIVDLTF